ncbi:hypothetical protein JTE90_026452 [Oedothorax gibbosus]|uniref:Uncharacterized protein n=1 Tax=Oedothorax gibbosus TaxID=931172 RepID=A0AAV6VSQ8_9ARAC|nr:hypothetical protein JTE90_026452 [Oedothorax gibbosus]
MARLGQTWDKLREEIMESIEENGFLLKIAEEEFGEIPFRNAVYRMFQNQMMEDWDLEREDASKIEERRKAIHRRVIERERFVITRTREYLETKVKMEELQSERVNPDLDYIFENLKYSSREDEIDAFVKAFERNLFISCEVDLENLLHDRNLIFKKILLTLQNAPRKALYRRYDNLTKAIQRIMARTGDKYTRFLCEDLHVVFVNIRKKIQNIVRFVPLDLGFSGENIKFVFISGRKGREEERIRTFLLLNHQTFAASLVRKSSAFGLA